jgi:hypothetical protein
VPGANPALLASAISIGHTMKQVLNPWTSRMRSGRTYKGRNWQPRRRNSEFELVEFKSLINDFISILGYGPSKPYFADLALTHLPPPIGKKPKRSSRKSRQNRCIAVKSSVPQGMFVCFDKRGWLVCRNSGDTEGCREGVRKRSRWRERLRRCCG